MIYLSCQNLHRQRQRSDRSNEVDERVQQNIAMMVERLVERFTPEQIILFGSHARGTADLESDVDLLVIMPVVGSKREKRVEMRMALDDITVPKDVLVATPEEVARDRNLVGSIIRPALSEGKLLYARS